ncbi:MAG: hypothetical protein AAGG01_24155, partial [Planctomycetota bacterium]
MGSVEFHLAGLSSVDPSGVQLLLVSDEHDGVRRERTFDAQGVTRFDLIAGRYHCAAYVGGLVGPVAEFHVEPGAATLRVELGMPEPFDVQAIVAHDRTGARLSLVNGTFVRLDLPTELQAAPLSGASDASGVVAVEGLTAGHWRFSLSRAGFETYEFDVELPGGWSNQLAESGHVDFGTLTLVELTPLSVKLEGAMDWGGGAGFRLAVGDQGEPVPFSPSGDLTLALGWYRKPLYLKLYYPNANRLGIHLDAGVPAGDEPLILDVTKSRRLEVEIAVASDVVGDLELRSSSFNVTGVSRRGDSITQGASVDGPGVYVVEGVEADRVTVSFSTMLDGDRALLAREQVKMRPAGATTCMLLVSSLPRKVVVQHRNGSQPPRANSVLRERPDRTSWTHSQPLGEGSTLTLPGPSSAEYSLRLSGLEDRFLAIDVPYEIDPRLDRLEIGNPKDTRTRILVDGVPRAGLQVEIAGLDCSAVCAADFTDGEGWTPTWKITDDSQMVIRVGDQSL